MSQWTPFSFSLSLTHTHTLVLSPHANTHLSPGLTLQHSLADVSHAKSLRGSEEGDKHEYDETWACTTSMNLPFTLLIQFSSLHSLDADERKAQTATGTGTL